VSKKITFSAIPTKNSIIYDNINVLICKNNVMMTLIPPLL